MPATLFMHIIAFLFVTAACVQDTASESVSPPAMVKAQEAGISDLETRLAQQGVPVTNIEATSRIPFRIEAVLQSDSVSGEVMPEDPQFVHLVQREVALSPRQGNPKVDSLKVTVLNTQGEPIYWADEPVKLVQEGVTASAVNDEAATDAARERLSPHGMSLEEISVSSSDDGSQILLIGLVALDTQTANAVIPSLMKSVRNLPNELNDSVGTQIMVVKLDVSDSSGQPLLTYSYDLELSKQKWWQSEGLTKDWFPGPAPEPGS